MEFLLALELKMTVAQLRRSVSGHEFAEWQAFFVWRQQVREAEESRARGGASQRRGGMGR